MKINKEDWRQMNYTGQKNTDANQITPLPDTKLGDEIYYPKIDHPKHYNTGKYETIDIIEDWRLGFHCGNAIKYISRHKYKENAKQDIEKSHLVFATLS